MCEFPHNLPSKLTLYPHGIFAAGGAYVPTQEKKTLYPLGIFAAGGAYVPTQEKKKTLRIFGTFLQNFSNQMARFFACLINLRNYPHEKSSQNVKQSRIVNATISQLHCFVLTKCEAIKNSQCNYKSNSLFHFRNYRKRRLNPQKAALSFYTTLIPRHRSQSCFY